MKELKQEKDYDVEQLRRENKRLGADNAELRNRIEKLKVKIR